MKKILKYLLDVFKTVLFVCLVQICTIETFIGTHSIFKPYIPKMSYVVSINTPIVTNEAVKKSLDKFNKLGYSDIVSYNTKFIPIWIGEWEEMDDNTLGLAMSTMLGCFIFLNPKPLLGNDNKIEQVVIHEYLHCMGQAHTFNDRDLMYPSYNKSSKKNLEKWAKSLHLRMK